jgi:hypothetical protein
MTGINAVIRMFRGAPPQQWGATGRAEFGDLPGADAPSEFYEAFDRINAEVFNNDLERIPIRVDTPKFNSGFVSHYNDVGLGLEFIGFWETFPRDREYMFEHMARHMAYVSRRSPSPIRPAPSAPSPSLPASPPGWDDSFSWYEPDPIPPAGPVYAELKAPDVPLQRWIPDLARAVQPAPARPNLEPMLMAALKTLASVQRSASRQPRAIPAAPVATPAAAPAGLEAMLAALAQAMAAQPRPFIDVTPRPVASGLLPTPAIEPVFDLTPGVRAKTPTGRR